MNSSHNLSGLTKEVSIMEDELDIDAMYDSVERCVEEFALRELTYRPSSMFFRPDELD